MLEYQRVHNGRSMSRAQLKRTGATQIDHCIRGEVTELLFYNRRYWLGDDWYSDNEAVFWEVKLAESEHTKKMMGKDLNEAYQSDHYSIARDIWDAYSDNYYTIIHFTNYLSLDRAVDITIIWCDWQRTEIVLFTEGINIIHSWRQTTQHH